MVRKQVGALVDEDVWTVLKTHCVRNKLNIVDRAGQIIEEWVKENCSTDTGFQ